MNLTSKDISEDFPNSGKIYLNNASVSLMPSQSIEAMKDFLISYNFIKIEYRLLIFVVAISSCCFC